MPVPKGGVSGTALYSVLLIGWRSKVLSTVLYIWSSLLCFSKMMPHTVVLHCTTRHHYTPHHSTHCTAPLHTERHHCITQHHYTSHISTYLHIERHDYTSPTHCTTQHHYIPHHSTQLYRSSLHTTPQRTTSLHTTLNHSKSMNSLMRQSIASTPHTNLKGEQVTGKECQANSHL